MAAPRGSRPAEGDGPLLPESHYAAAKLAGEALISGFASLYGWRAYAFRFGNTVGPRSNHGVVHDFVVKLLRDPTRLEILGDGTQAKPYIAVDDLVAGIRRGVAAAPPGPDDDPERRDRGNGDGQSGGRDRDRGAWPGARLGRPGVRGPLAPVEAVGRATRPTSSSRPRRCGRSGGSRGCRPPRPSRRRREGSPTAIARRGSRSSPGPSEAPIRQRPSREPGEPAARARGERGDDAERRSPASRAAWRRRSPPLPFWSGWRRSWRPSGWRRSSSTG